MVIYRRKRNTIYTARLIGILILMSCITLYLKGFGDYAFVLAFLSLAGVVFPADSINIYKDSFNVTRYICYGWLAKSYEFDITTTIKISPVNVELELAHTTGTIWDLFIVFFPAQKIKTQKYNLTKTDHWNNSQNVLVKLNEEELKMIKEIASLDSQKN